MEANTVLDVQALSRDFGARRALQGLTLRLQRGEILGLLGPNGAGKTTCLQMLAGQRAPSAGAIALNGIDVLRAPRQAKRVIGYLPERPPLYPDLRLAEYLDYCGRLHGLSSAARRRAVGAVLAECGLEQVAKALLGRLSKGYRQRVGLAQALVHDPALLLLDEPGDGLDPSQNQELRRLIRRRAAAGCAVIFSSHRLDEVEHLCTRVLILRDGREAYRADLTPGAASGAETQAGAQVRVRLVPPSTPAALAGLEPVASAEALDDGRLRLRLQPDCSPAQLSRLLVERGFGLDELSPEPSVIERLFLSGFGVVDHAP